MGKSIDQKYMLMALELAEKATDMTYPNPMVGAVIVKNGHVLGSGYHKRAGLPHAEPNAIVNCRGKCTGATMYVTLEPCDHHGKTPPCTKAIIDSGIKHVNVAMKDPNHINSGRGLRRLRNAGISVTVGQCGAEAKKLNRKYIKFIKNGMPYITIKLAQSLDGKIAARNGTSKWISSDESRKYTRKLRHKLDAIMVGINTVVNDNPFLLDEKKRGYKTARVVVDSKLKIPLNSNLIKTASKSPVIIATTSKSPKSKRERLSKIDGVEVIVVNTKNQKVSLKRFLKKLAQKNLVNVMVEGGGTLVGSFIDESLVDEVMFFIAPKIIGGNYVSVGGSGVSDISKVVELKDVTTEKFGQDILVRGLVK